jgi:hypothetical protein
MGRQLKSTVLITNRSRSNRFMTNTKRRNSMTRQRSILALLVAVLLVLTGEATAKDRIQQSFDVPAQFTATIQTSECTATPGPRVNLAGSLVISPVDIEVIFSHPQHMNDPQSSVEVRRAVVPPNAPPTAAPQQSIVGPMGNNPFLWLQLTDSKGRPLTSEVFLGRCDQGQFSPTVDLLLPTEAFADVSADSCNVSSGPVISLNGQMQTAPIHGKVIFRNSNEIGLGGPRPGEAAIDVVFMAAGPAFLLPQDSAQAGTGGNPLISTQYRLGTGVAIGIEEKLGRCSAIVN